MKTIFIIITRGSLLMNFFHSGIASKLLDTKIRLVVLTPFFDRRELFEPYRHEHLVIEPLHESPHTFYSRFALELLKGAIFNKTVHTRYLHRITASDTPPSKWWYIPRMIFFAPLRLIPGIKPFVRWLDFHLAPQKENDALFKKYKPDLVFSTSPAGVSDTSVLKAAKRFGVKTVALPKSWDTLSKFLFPVKTDRLLVWSPYSKEQALRYQGYTSKEVLITGAPQFDFYADKRRLLFRAEFCRLNNLDPSKKIILYGSTGSRACYEYRYVDLIKTYMDKGLLPDVQVLVRPHVAYIGDGEQFAHLKEVPNFVLDKQDKQDPRFKDNWNVSDAHIAHLFNSLHHADVCINVASTLTIDALLNGTPVININFDFPNIEPNMSVKRLYKSDYVEAITAFGATWVAKSAQEYLEALQEIVLKGAKKEGREAFIEYFAYKRDGRARERIAVALLENI